MLVDYCEITETPSRSGPKVAPTAAAASTAYATIAYPTPKKLTYNCSAHNIFMPTIQKVEAFTCIKTMSPMITGEAAPTVGLVGSRQTIAVAPIADASRGHTLVNAGFKIYIGRLFGILPADVLF